MPIDLHTARLLRLLSASALDSAKAPYDPHSRRADLLRLAEAAAEQGGFNRRGHGIKANAAGETDGNAPTWVDIFALEDGPSRPLRAYHPSQSRGGIMLYLHGGGWVAGGLETHDGVCRRLAAGSGCRVLALDYRLAPEHPFPAALEDVLEALEWIASGALGADVDPERLVLAGDSAGANIAAAAALVARDEALPAPALLLLICPILDLAEERISRRLFGRGRLVDALQLARDFGAYAGDADRGDPRLSPLQAKSLFGLPPTILHSAEFDPFRDEAAAFAAALHAAGTCCAHTVHAGMIHYFYALGRAIPAGRRALDEMAAQVARFMES